MVQEESGEEEGKGREREKERERRRGRILDSGHLGWSKGDQPPEWIGGQLGRPLVLMTVKFG